jgi:hypothetical protein
MIVQNGYGRGAAEHRGAKGVRGRHFGSEAQVGAVGGVVGVGEQGSDKVCVE